MNQVLPRQRRPWPRLGPALDVRGVLVGHADGPAIEPRAAARREVEDELVAVVDEAVAVDRLVVADRHVAIEPGRRAGGLAVDGDRLDPVDRVLELQVLPRHLRDLERNPGVGRLGADVQEQGPVAARAPGPPRASSARSRRGSSPRGRSSRSCGSGCRGCRAET